MCVCVCVLEREREELESMSRDDTPLYSSPKTIVILVISRLLLKEGHTEIKSFFKAILVKRENINKQRARMNVRQPCNEPDIIWQP